jgi:hypothetical protein
LGKVNYVLVVSQLKFQNNNFYSFSNYWSNIKRRKTTEVVTDLITLLTTAIRRSVLHSRNTTYIIVMMFFLQIKYVVLVNCGGTIDIVEALQPKEDVVFFVIDSHKPTDVCNVYNNGQVR